MTTSGQHSAIADLSRGKSRMSAQMERTAPATSACSNRLGWVGGSRAYPVTLAPSASSHSESQLPLKPVCPVRKTLRSLQNERLSMIIPSPAFFNSAGIGRAGVLFTNLALCPIEQAFPAFAPYLHRNSLRRSL